MLGTLVWDTIHPPGAAGETPVEEWGGICYALSAFEVAGPPGWSLVPIVKVGEDMRGEARELFAELDRVGSLEGVRVVDAPNNRVELRYRDRERRTERLSGGVPGWSWRELAPLAASCDALYVNFIAGWELELDVARRLPGTVPGPLYADLHSLFLDTGPDGVRRPGRPEHGGEWLSCFDLVQMNEDELGWLAAGAAPDSDGGGDPWRAAGRAVGRRPRAVLVTRGASGARWVPPAPDFGGLPLGPGEADGPEDPASGRARAAAPGAERPGEGMPFGEEPAAADVDDPDPTGCGDVWGVTCFAALLSGSGIRDAVRHANRMAARNARHRGGRALTRPRDGGTTLEA